MAGKMNMSKMYGRKNEKTAPKKSPYIAPEMREENQAPIIEKNQQQKPKPEKKERKQREKKEPANIGKDLSEIKEVLEKAAEYEKQNQQQTPEPVTQPTIEEKQTEQPAPEKKQVGKFSNTNFETTICFDPEMIVGYNIGLGKEYIRQYGKTVFILNEDSNIFGLEKFMKQGIKRLPYLGINTAEQGDIICIDNKGLAFPEVVDYVCQHISDCLLMICSPVIREDDLMPILRKSKDGSGTEISVNAGTIGSIHSRLVSRSNIFRFHHDPMFLQSSSAIDKFVRNTGMPELLMPFYISQLAFEIRYNKETERWPDNEDEFRQTFRIGNPIYFISDTRMIFGCEYELFEAAATAFINAIKEQIEATGEKAPSIEELAINMLDENELPQNLLQIKRNYIAQMNAEQQQPEVQQPQPQQQQPNIAPEKNPMQEMVEELLGESLDEPEMPAVNQEVIQEANYETRQIYNDIQEVPVAENPVVMEAAQEEIQTPPADIIPETVNANLDAQFEVVESEFSAGDKVHVNPVLYEVDGENDISIPESDDCYMRVISDVYGMAVVEHPEGLNISDFEEQIDIMSAADSEFSNICKQLDRSKNYVIVTLSEIQKV
jgi:hypothetical protein